MIQVNTITYCKQLHGSGPTQVIISSSVPGYSSFQLLNFSRIQASNPTGESHNPYAKDCGLWLIILNSLPISDLVKETPNPIIPLMDIKPFRPFNQFFHFLRGIVEWRIHLQPNQRLCKNTRRPSRIHLYIYMDTSTIVSPSLSQKSQL